MSPEEEKIWLSIQQKDMPVFEQYYKAHYRFFFLAAYRYLADTGLAQEVVNDVFMRCWQDGEKITIQTSLRSYLYRAVANQCLNILDKQKRDRHRLSQMGQWADETTEGKRMEDDELRIRLYQAIDRLPEQCGKVFRMSRFEGLKQQEIADRLQLSIKTVKNHITHALQQLQRVLDQWNSLPFWIAVIKIFWRRH